MSYFGNLFYATFPFLNKHKDGFIPFQGTGGRSIGYNGEEWIEVSLKHKAFKDIPRLSTVIRKKALLHANVCYKVVDNKGKEITRDDARFSELYKLLDNPNPTQGLNRFVIQREHQKALYGNQFMYKNKASRVQDWPTALWNISPRYLAPYLTGNVFDQKEMKGIISKFVYQDGKTKKDYKTEEILFWTNPDVDDPVIGVSPLDSITRPLTILRAAYVYNNKVLSNSGPPGILTPDGGKGEDATVVTSTERTRLHQDFLEKYGVEANQIGLLITEKAMKFQAMGFPVKQMMIHESISSEFLMLCDHYGMDSKIFSNDGTKYDDMQQAIIKTYQDTIIPEADEDAQALTPFLLPERFIGQFRIIASFDHVPILKLARKPGLEGAKMMMETLEGLVTSEIITAQQAYQYCISELESLRIN